MNSVILKYDYDYETYETMKQFDIVYEINIFNNDVLRKYSLDIIS
jgi:hypothetical protein